MAKDRKSFNTNSNAYTVIYSAVIVVVVAFLLAFVSSSLKPMQDINVSLDKKKQILASLNIRDLSDSEVDEMYKNVVLSDEVIDEKNNVLLKGTPGGEEAGFKLNSADFKDGKLALYICKADGKTKYVIPVYGMGLWGPISGYIAVNEDKNTIYGVYFNHESETAGLGAEIKDNKAWQRQFIGKKIMKPSYDGIALSVVKKNDVKDKSVECDAITGATLTSDGVSLMLKDCLGKYVEFLNNK